MKPGTHALQISQTIRRLRSEAHLTQAELAARSGLEANHIAQLENRRVKRLTVDTLHALAKGLGLTLDEAAGEFGYAPTIAASAADAAAVTSRGIERQLRRVYELPEGPEREAIVLMVRNLGLLAKVAARQAAVESPASLASIGAKSDKT
ncbi:MAG: helix-turn-helix transcriptional regulator [Dehalococcoidia bacterium]